MVDLREIEIDEKPVLKNYLHDYLIELSQITETEINTNYKYLDSYFTDKNRKAFFILKDQEIIGFVFLNQHCIIKTNEIAIAEFYIQKEYRNKGFAKDSAQKIFKLFNKNWEVKTSIKNQVALSFWRKAIGNFSEEIIDENLIFSFKN